MSPGADLIKSPSLDKWNKIGLSKRAGILVPLFSVFSRESTGIGDIHDLKILSDWIKATDGSILQLLPMNEMGANSCPYDAVSSFALEPAYLSLNRLEPRPPQSSIRKIRDSFPLPRERLDYSIRDAKLEILWQLFQEEDVAESGDFGGFIARNGYWLEDFALFKVLKYYQQGRPWYEWQDSYRNRDSHAMEDFKKAHEREIRFQKWLQWQLYCQFKEARGYISSKGILIEGDLPVLVSRDSADVWAHPDFFKLEFAAGAPPDMYCAKGQRWGMPPYDWRAIADNSYLYLKEKLRFAQEFYDILRIDHVVGLFRIWSIPYNEPLENKGLNGFFDPCDENLWYGHGRKILSEMIKATDMLLCAEDLGLIPPVCTDTIRELGIPGNDVQRWTKDWQGRHDFLLPGEYRMLSVAMLSTHDTTNWPAWWENEAGTIDEALFERRCGERGIDFFSAKQRLFEAGRSGHARLRWRQEIESPDKLVSILGRKREELGDFIEMYENTYREKEKLWRHLELDGVMREACGPEIIGAALRFTLKSNSIFSIQLISDVLLLGGILSGDPYQYRINTPGTSGPQNWSWVTPVALEDLIRHPLTARLKEAVASSGRI